MKNHFLAAILASVLALPGCDAKEPSWGSISQSKRLSAEDGVAIAYTVAGNGDQALVFIHGWAGDRTYWRHQLSHFARSYTVVGLDLAGHGESGVSRITWTLDALARDVVAVLEQETLDDVILVAHSLGAPVALLATPAAGRRVIGVIIVDALHDVEMPHGDRTLQFVAALESDFAGTLLAGVPRLFGAAADSRLVAEIANDMASAPPDLSIAPERSYAGIDFRAAMGAVAVPIRAINAGATNVEGNRKYARDFDALQMEGSGHFPMLERPSDFNALLAQVVSEIVQAALLRGRTGSGSRPGVEIPEKNFQGVGAGL